jgi:shikimate kinase
MPKLLLYYLLMSNQFAQSIALVGLSGTGKSTVGRLLAARLGWPLLDTDVLVVAEAGCSIAHLFATAGEPHFRARETAALQTALGEGQRVVATGGGIVLAPQNRAMLKERAFVVWLDAPTELLVARLQAHDEERPLLAAGMVERLEALRAARETLYAEVADMHVNTAERSAEEIAQEIRAMQPAHGHDRYAQKSSATER